MWSNQYHYFIILFRSIKCLPEYIYYDGIFGLGFVIFAIDIATLIIMKKLAKKFNWSPEKKKRERVLTAFVSTQKFKKISELVNLGGPTFHESKGRNKLF